MRQKTIDRLLASGKWMIRMSNDGISYEGFKWNPPGKWTKAPDWDDRPTCSGGLFGQSPQGAGHCKCGTRLELCETGKQVPLDGKIKTPRARILAVNEAVPAVFLETLFALNGALDLSEYAHSLPEGLKNLRVINSYFGPCPASLPESLESIYGNLCLSKYSSINLAGLKFISDILCIMEYPKQNVPGHLSWIECGQGKVICIYTDVGKCSRDRICSLWNPA